MLPIEASDTAKGTRLQGFESCGGLAALLLYPSADAWDKHQLGSQYSLLSLVTLLAPGHTEDQLAQRAPGVQDWLSPDC